MEELSKRIDELIKQSIQQERFTQALLYADIAMALSEFGYNELPSKVNIHLYGRYSNRLLKRAFDNLGFRINVKPKNGITIYLKKWMITSHKTKRWKYDCNFNVLFFLFHWLHITIIAPITAIIKPIIFNPSEASFWSPKLKNFEVIGLASYTITTPIVPTIIPNIFKNNCTFFIPFFFFLII